MKNLLISILEPLGFPIIQQGSLSPDEPYPEHFFTFWNRDTTDIEFYDNEEHATVWEFDLNFYSVDPDMVSSQLLEARRLLKANDFIVTGKGYDVGSDEVTHTGRGMTVLKVERQEEN